MRYPLVITLLALAACDHLQDDGKAVANQAKADSTQMASNTADDAVGVATLTRDNLKQTGEKLHQWIVEPPPAKGAPQPIPSTYCYRVLQDILCYRRPMPGWEYRLVAYQGTGALPPPPAMMQLLPTKIADSQPAGRVASPQPVFATPPAPLKQDKTPADQAQPSAVDPAHEQLPDPALAPQL